MALIEAAECKITALNNHGLGVGSTEQGVVELPYVLPGDIAEFERHSYRGKSNCILKNITEINSNRNTPLCKYFGACGGCLLQHLTDEDYAAFKYKLLESALAEYEITASVAPMVTIKGGSRRRANLEAIKKNGQLYLGFHRFHSHQIINIDECVALLPELSNLLHPLKITLSEVMEDKQKLQMFITKASNGIDLSLEIQNCQFLEENKRIKLRSFAEEYNLTRLIFRYRKKVDVIYGTETPYILFDNIPVEIDAYCFLQASFESDNILSGLVRKYIESPNSDQKLVDLFCGRGTYTLPLSNVFDIDGYESDQKAIAALSAAVLENKRSINVYKRDLFADPLSFDELNKYSACVINPPRAGAEAQINEIAKGNIKKLCYISCNPITFSRDSKTLINAGYKLVELTPVDQFYWSPHLEIVGYFER